MRSCAPWRHFLINFSNPDTGLYYRRLSIIAGILLCFGALGTAYFIEYQLHILPCPLCILQRWVLWAMGLIFLLNLLGYRQKWLSWILVSLNGLLALAGIGLAGRQIWLQSLPSGTAPACGASFDRLLETYPWFDAIRHVLTTAGECAEIPIRILGLSLPNWTLVSFLGLSLLCLYQAKYLKISR